MKPCKTFLYPVILLFIFVINLGNYQKLHAQTVNLVTPDFYEWEGNPADADGPCIAPGEHRLIKARIDRAIKNMREAGVFEKHFDSRQRMVHPLFDWPMKQAEGFDDPGYYAISNYVDLDPDSAMVLDYNGLNQTYDGHNGCDIRTDPYFWKKKQDNQVEAIAAEDGVIIFKVDGFFDNNCSCVNGNWNAIFLAHADGSVTWYGHLKNGTTTPKDSGDFVSVGEYLGFIGSSGCSSNPHLHFEVYDNLGNRIEPFAGPSNPTTNDSWWANQLPYYDSGINKIATHSSIPTAPACPGIEVPNEKYVFDAGEAMSFSIAIRHSITSDSAVVETFEPDGDPSTLIDLTYIRMGTFFLRTALPVWNRTLANNAPKGKWRYRVTYYSGSYGTQVEEINFWVAENCVGNLVHNAPMTQSKYYQASNTITSSSVISNNVHIVYDAENITTLTPGFQAPVGSKLEVKTNGCN